MRRKPMTQEQAGTSTRSVGTEEVRSALREGRHSLEAREEKALRMRHGVGGGASLPLEQVGQEHPETRARLLDMELELLKQWRARSASGVSTAPEARSNPRRDRIVAALASKKAPRRGG